MRKMLTALVLVAAATSAMAHGLTVFASVQDGMVVVEAKFSNGKAPVSGDVRVLDAQSALVQTLTLDRDGTVRFALDPAAAATGLTIEVTTGDGHDNYWILTPDDIARGTGG